LLFHFWDMFNRASGLALARGWQERRLYGAGVALSRPFLERALRRRSLLSVDEELAIPASQRPDFHVSELHLPTRQDGVVKTLTPWVVVFRRWRCIDQLRDVMEIDIDQSFGVLLWSSIESQMVGLAYQDNISIHGNQSDAFWPLRTKFDLAKAEEAFNRVGINKRVWAFSISDE
jgi:hypothetical protein